LKVGCQGVLEAVLQAVSVAVSMVVLSSFWGVLSAHTGGSCGGTNVDFGVGGTVTVAERRLVLWMAFQALFWPWHSSKVELVMIEVVVGARDGSDACGLADAAAEKVSEVELEVAVDEALEVELEVSEPGAVSGVPGAAASAVGGSAGHGVGGDGV